LKNVPVESVKQFEKEYLEFLELQHQDILDKLGEGILNDEITAILEKVAAEIANKFKEKEPKAAKK
jgi:F-type H+-transporting ATPase subunit alpha